MQHKKKEKEDIELNIMMVIVILVIVIFAITMIISIIKGNSEEEQVDESNITTKTNEANIQSTGETNSTNNEIQNNSNTLQEDSNIVQENNNEVQNNNSVVQEETEKKTYSTSETVPFKVDGAKIVDGDLQTGLTIEDSNGNQWVWIEVPKSITQNATEDAEIERKLEEYVKTDSAGDNFIESRDGYTDANYPGTWLVDEKYNQMKSKMLQSIKSNGGFYIGKYETGYEPTQGSSVRQGNSTTREYPINETPVIKLNAYPYNWVNVSQAENLAERLSTGGKTTSLLFGLQWDLVLKYYKVKGNADTSLLLRDSSTWGNYNNVLLKTGRTSNASKLGINDLAGNLWELTLEKNSKSQNLCTVRGGSFKEKGAKAPVSYRGNITANTCDVSIGFRCTMY